MILKLEINCLRFANPAEATESSEARRRVGMDALDMLGGTGNATQKLKQIWIRKYGKPQAENTKNVRQNSWKIIEILLKIPSEM